MEEEQRKHEKNTREFKRETDVLISSLFVSTCANVVDIQNEMIVLLKHPSQKTCIVGKLCVVCMDFLSTLALVLFLLLLPFFLFQFSLNVTLS